MDTTTIRVREPRELLALLPYQLGFQPQDSAVAVALRPPRGRVGLIARVDLPDLAEPEAGPGLSRRLVTHLVGDGASRALLVVYVAQDPRPWGGTGDPEPSVQRAVRHFREAAAGFLGDVSVWVVGADGYLSLDCTDADCCPPGGRPLRDLQSTEVGAHMVLAGAMVADSRETLVPDVPAPARARRNAVRAARRSSARRAAATGADLAAGTVRRTAAGTDRRTAAGADRGPAPGTDCGTGGGEVEVAAGDGSSLAAWRADGLRTWRAELAAARPGDTPATPASPAALGRLMAALDDVQVRDAVLLTLVDGAGDLPERSVAARPPGDDALGRQVAVALAAIVSAQDGVPPHDATLAAATALLERVVSHSGAARRAPALTLLGLLAWWHGDGARAAVLLERALTADPGHRLAHLVADALTAGLAPGWVRAPR